jgi:hypothetical protein
MTDADITPEEEEKQIHINTIKMANSITFDRYKDTSLNYAVDNLTQNIFDVAYELGFKHGQSK